MSSYFDWLVENTKTTWWHDSGDQQELAWSLEHRASGVTTNPVLIAATLRGSGDHWQGEVDAAFGDGLADEERAERLVGIVVRSAASRLAPIYDGGTAGREGYVCAQVNPARAAERAEMTATVRRFHGMAPNISVKVPASLAGLEVAEQCIAEGISMTITVSFTVAQVLAIGAMVDRAGERAAATGRSPGQCNAVVMIGRIDDYLRDIAADTGASVTEADIRQAGIAVVKRAYRVCRERGYRSSLCVAALRGSHHMTAIAGGDLIVSIHPKHQAPLLEPGMPREERMDHEVPPEVISRLLTMPEFRKAYEPDGLAPSEFLAYGPTQRTLSQFIAAGWRQIEAFRP